MKKEELIKELNILAEYAKKNIERDGFLDPVFFIYHTLIQDGKEVKANAICPITHQLCSKNVVKGQLRASFSP